MKKQKDDYNWDTYTKTSYTREVLAAVNSGYDIIVKDFELDENGEVVILNDKGLHANSKEIFRIIHKLKVKSIYECGCGCAQTLIGNQIINPELEVNGSDYAQSQIDLGYKHFNLDKYDFHKRLKVIDMTNIENIDSLGTHELVYSHAVTMHLSYDRAKMFLLNMKKLSSKYIFMVENTTKHDYDKFITEIFPEFERIIDNKYIPNGILLKRK
jgi:hypothetical protein